MSKESPVESELSTLRRKAGGVITAIKTQSVEKVRPSADQLADLKAVRQQLDALEGEAVGPLIQRVDEFLIHVPDEEKQLTEE